MAGRSLKILLWQGRRWGRRLGWPWLTFFALAMPGMYLMLDADEQSRQVTALRRSARPHAIEPAPALPDIGDQNQALTEFDQRLPAREEISSRLRRLLDLAAKRHVHLAKGEYQSVADAQAHLTRYQMNFPVKGDAAAIQGFVLAALAAEPALMLDAISFRRESATTGETDAHLRFSLLVRLP